MPGSRPPPKKPPMYGAYAGPGVPVRDAPAADGDLARIGVLAALDALGVGLASRDGAGLAPRRRPLDLARRRAVARVEEAGRRALRRLAALEAGARRGHRVAALLGRLADRLEVLRAARGVDRARRALVGAESLLVVALGLLGGAGHLDVEVERADLLAELDDVVADVRPHLLELRRLLAAHAAHARGDQQAEPRRRRRAAPARRSRRRRRRRRRPPSPPAGPHLAHAVDEVEQDRRQAFAALGLQRRVGRLRRRRPRRRSVLPARKRRPTTIT